MCNWTINWGDVPTWLGALGTLGAVFWAVFLYQRSLQDQQRAQARLLSPIGGSSTVQALAGTPVEPESVATDGSLVGLAGDRLVVANTCLYAQIRLVSTSNEAFSNIQVFLKMANGKRVHFPLTYNVLAPGEDRTNVVYYQDGMIGGDMQALVQFRDANGRWWERISGEPVRRLHRAPSKPTLWGLREEPE